MAFHIIRNDITKVMADAIVNTASPDVYIGDGVDAAIYKAAGEEKLFEERRRIGEIPYGNVAVTPAFGLNAKYIIHASGPWWEGGSKGEERILADCYEKSLEEAARLKCRSIAFPLMATGTYGFPREKALSTAVSAISRFLSENDMEVYLVVFDRNSVSVCEKMFSGLKRYVDDNYVSSALNDEYEGILPEALEDTSYKEICKEEPAALRSECSYSVDMSEPMVIEDLFDSMEMTFSAYLQQMINKKHMKNSEVYRKANLTKQYFSKLINGKMNPAKEKLLALAIAMELNMDETKDMLMMAGYALSPCSKVDLVVSYFISRQLYNIYDVEIALYDLNLPTLSDYQ